MKNNNIGNFPKVTIIEVNDFLPVCSGIDAMQIGIDDLDAGDILACDTINGIVLLEVMEKNDKVIRTRDNAAPTAQAQGLHARGMIKCFRPQFFGGKIKVA